MYEYCICIILMAVSTHASNALSEENLKFKVHTFSCNFQHRNGERNGETWKITYRDWKPIITMERGTWNSTGMPSAMPLSSFGSKMFNILLTKMNIYAIITCRLYIWENLRFNFEFCFACLSAISSLSQLIQYYSQSGGMQGRIQDLKLGEHSK